MLAYGQTGSGKTHTMGGGFGMCSPNAEEELQGVIPRVISDIYDGIQEHDGFDFIIRASYLEVSVCDSTRVP